MTYRDPVICNYCNKEAKFVDSKILYGHSYGMIYYCRACDAYVGIHKNSRTFKPLGFLANRELRELRKKCHALFDPFWKSGRMTRKQAYSILAEKLGIEVKKTHIAQFDIEFCNKTIEILEKGLTND